MGSELQKSFDRFWNAYPRQQAMGEAEREWKKIKPSAALTGVIIAAVEQQKKSREWRRENGQFIPQPGRWLKKQRWKDAEQAETGSEPSSVEQTEAYLEQQRANIGR